MLNNTVYKLKNDKALRVAYFGGSITEGAGSSNPEKTCYRAKMTKYLKDKFPDSDVTEINAAIGGTGTSLGMFRVNHDVLDYKPDLIFVEFATNDFGDSEGNVIPQTESIIRRIRSTLPCCDIVFLFSTALMVKEELDAGGKFESKLAQKKVCDHYGILTVDFGEYLLDYVYNKMGKVYEDYAPDTLHPGDNGYAVITDYIISIIGPLLDSEADTSLTPHSLQEKLDPISSDKGDIIYPAELNILSLDGFDVKNEKYDRFPSYLASEKGGSEFTFSFSGSGFGFYRAPGDAGADFILNIDGGNDILNLSWDREVRSFRRMANAVVTKTLEDTVHTVKLRVLGDGEFPTRIGGIFVC
ncbi:MAG: SGNH/GDSL hydrolase family protein [Clostridia bacterium]|nr:SGNH/GDSL hydrolase family protein [Clostridia bacterium]